MPENPLANLRDIHLPAEAGWWPPAPGWWILAALLLLLPLLWYGWQRWNKRERSPVYRRAALAELEQLHDSYLRDQDSAAFVQGMSGLLKRVALQCYDPASVAALSGQQWGEFLGKDQQPATRELVINSLNLVHSRQQELDLTAFYRFAQGWIEAQERF